jgi:aspartate beta-hydroxylase
MAPQHALARRAPMSSALDARRLLEGGRMAEAERAYERVLEANPDHIEALNVVALAALRNGRAPRALELLKRAARAAPEDAVTQHHLGLAHEATADSAAAASAQAAAVRLAPTFFVARLHLAGCLEGLGRREEAFIQFKRTLDDAQGQGRWLNQATTPAPLVPLVEHAVVTVRRERRAMLERVLAPLRARYGRESLTRVEHCLRIYLGEEPPVYPDPRQRPSFLLFPGLPTSAYFERAQLPWIEALEGETPAIRAELEQLLPTSESRERVFASEALEAENLRGLDVPPTWNGYYFFRHGERRDANCEACPATARALDALPLSRVREHGPEVLFSVFTAGTHLMPHRGVTNTRVVGHLPLIIPEDCALNVGGELHVWQSGRVVVFDDTYEHEAWNRSRSTRVVLIFDVWNPYLTDIERAAVTDLIGAIGDLRSALERA